MCYFLQRRTNTTPLTFSQWTNTLVKEGYLSEGDMKNLLIVKEEKEFWFMRWNKWTKSGFTVFAVTENDPANTLLFATKNWHGFSTNLCGEPYGNTRFLVFHKGGNGAILPSTQAAATNLIGAGGLHHYLPLK